KRAFEASTLQELVRLRESGTITNPSTLLRDLDPLIERVILRCLEADPGKRPASALQVAAALPGGDPLAAALAAGETPSPQMVAAAGSTEGIKPWLGIALVATVLLGLVAHIMQSDNFFNSIGSGVITPWEPPSDVTGMTSVFLDTHGRLLLFKRIPPERDPPGGPSPPPDWSPLFSAAGLDPSKFTSATPEWSD